MADHVAFACFIADELEAIEMPLLLYEIEHNEQRSSSAIVPKLVNIFFSKDRLRLSFSCRHLSRSGLTRDSSTAVLLSACASYVSKNCEGCDGLCLLERLVLAEVPGCSSTEAPAA